MEPDDIWQDDDGWWHQQDLEMQQQEELARAVARSNQSNETMTEKDNAK